MKAEALATFSTTTFKKGREKKETSPALVKQEDDWNDNHYDSVIKEEEKMEDRNNDNDNGDITDEPQGEMEEEVEAASEITEKEYVCSFAFLTLEYPQLHLIYMLMSFPSWKMVVTWIKFMLIDTHPELLEALEEATRSRDQKINHATKRYRLERERIARTFEAMQIANLSELKVALSTLFYYLWPCSL